MNALFAGNAATAALTAAGAAIYVSDAAPFSLIHATIGSPTVPTGATQAIYVAGGTVYLTNTLIATHTIGIARAGGAVGDRNTLFAGVTTPYNGAVTSVGGITGPADFVNPAAGDYHLGLGSAALDAGIDAGVYSDFEGDIRPLGRGFDIGYDQNSSPRCYATPNDGTTVFTSVDAAAVRDALAAVAANGTVKVAGYCAGVASQGGTTQVALITQTLTLAGGYATTNWASYNPAGNPTTLDALSGGRVISTSVAAHVTLRGFTATNGFISSTVAAYGGGIFASGAMTLTDMNVSGNILIGTSSIRYGGGAYASGAANVSNTTFSNNYARTNGGGLYANATLALSGTQFLSNTAATQSGGGAYATGMATLNGGVFQNNSAGGFGGGLYAFSTLALTGTQFLSNTAPSGGGAYAFGAATLNSGMFQNNSAEGFGGGLYALLPLALIGGVFQNNSAGDRGGGLIAYSTLALTGTQFVRNTASAGGAIYLNEASAKRAVNALFAGNAATANGAAIYVADAAPFSLIHATIVSPTAPAGGTQAVYVAAGTVYLTNTLIATHTIGIRVAGGAASDWNTLFAGVTTPYSGTVTSVGGSTGTAGFVNPAADDYHLGAGSAALNAGIDAGVYTDFDGQARPQGGGFDIGYDESSFAPLTPRAYLPMVVR